MAQVNLGVCVLRATGDLPALDGFSLSGGLSDWYVRFGPYSNGEWLDEASCGVRDDTSHPIWDGCCYDFATARHATLRFELLDFDFIGSDALCCARR